jgi:hypothetical protein
MARWLIVAGLALAGLGVILGYAPWLVFWFGKLPGDIRYESGNTKVFIPVTSMIVVSIVLTVLVNLFRR